MTRRMATVFLVLGAVASAVILVSPALLPGAGADVLLAGVLPVGFFAAGALALLLRPAHLVGRVCSWLGCFTYSPSPVRWPQNGCATTL